MVGEFFRSSAGQNWAGFFHYKLIKLISPPLSGLSPGTGIRMLTVAKEIWLRNLTQDHLTLSLPPAMLNYRNIHRKMGFLRLGKTSKITKSNLKPSKDHQVQH